MSCILISIGFLSWHFAHINCFYFPLEKKKTKKKQILVSETPLFCMY